MPRKHLGIIQKGKNAGRLRKGYRFNGKRTKTGLPIIVKVHQKQRRQRGGYDGGPVEDTTPVDNIPPSPPPMPLLRRQNAIHGQRALDNVRREQRERQRLRAQAAVQRMRNRNSNQPRRLERN